MKFEIITSPDDFVALRGEMEANLRHFPDSFFYSPCWLAPFHKVLGSEGGVAHIIGRDDQGTISGSVHFSLVRTPFLKIFHPQVLALLGTRSVVSPEHLDFPIRREAWDEWFGFLADYIRDEMRRCAFAVFDSVAEKAPCLDAFMTHLRRSGFRVIRQEQDVCPYLDLPESFETLLEGYSPNMRKIIRRSLRRAQDKVRMVDYREIGDVEKALQEARCLHTLSREKKGDEGSFERPGYIEFHRELIRCLLDEDKLYLKFLVSGQTPVAFRYGFVVDGVYYDYQTGYDPAYEEWRPGFVILALIAEDLIGRKVKQFDFLRGNESYKRHWAHSDRKTYRYYAFPAGMKSWIYSAIWRLYHGIK